MEEENIIQAPQPSNGIEHLGDWKTKRELLIREVYGNVTNKNARFKIPSNKVHSKDLFEVVELTKEAKKGKEGAKELLEARVFQDFGMAIQGVSTVSFQCKVNEHNGDVSMDWVLNTNIKDVFKTEFSNLAIDVIYKITQIKASIAILKEGYTISGKCVIAFVVEVERFLNQTIFQRIEEVSDKGRLKSISSLIRLCESLDLPLSLLTTFANDVVDRKLIGSDFINILNEKASEDKTFFHQILRKTLNQCNQFYYEWVHEWIYHNDLASDRYFEFCIWDLCKASLNGTNVNKEDGNPSYLTSQKFTNFTFAKIHSEDLFSKRFVSIQPACPKMISEVLFNKLVKSGNYMFVKSNYLNVEEKWEAQQNEQDDLTLLIEGSFNRFGKNLIVELNKKFDLYNLVEQFPAYFWGINNNWLHYFIETTEDEETFQPVEIARGILGDSHLQNAFAKSIQKAPRADLSFMENFKPSLAQDVRDFWHQPTDYDEPTIVEMELDYKMEPSFSLVYPPDVYEPYRGLFRLSHAMKRSIEAVLRMKQEQIFVLRDDQYNQSIENPFNRRATPEELKAKLEQNRIQVLVLDALFMFLNRIYDYIFTNVIQKEVAEFVPKIQKAKNIDQFTQLQLEMINNIRKRSCTTTDDEQFIRRIWFFTINSSKMARGTLSFEDGCRMMCKSIRNLKKWVVRKNKNQNLNKFAAWLFGANLTFEDNEDQAVALIHNISIRQNLESSFNSSGFSSNLSQNSQKQTENNHAPLRLIQNIKQEY